MDDEESLVGKKFKNLLVIAFFKKIKSRNFWVCRCECGNEKNIPEWYLKNKAISCGCIRGKRKPVKHTREKYIGQKIGMLLITDILEGKHSRERLAVCDCDCGEKNKKVLLRSIIEKNSYSCGCQKDKNKFSKKENKYDLSSFSYGVGYTLKNEVFYFDKSDFEEIKKYCWYVSSDGYIKTCDENRKSLFLHRLVLNLKNKKNPLVDHKNGVKNDNRKENLRICNHSQNSMNAKHPRKNVGVTFSKSKNLYRARITFQKKVIHLGYFEKLEDAVKARQDAQEKFFGEFNVNNRNEYSSISPLTK